MSAPLDIWSAGFGLRVSRGMGHKETPWEELEWMRLAEDLALEHQRKLEAAGYGYQHVDLETDLAIFRRDRFGNEVSILITDWGPLVA